MIPKDHVIYKVKGDVACFYSSCAAHIYQDDSHMQTLRMISHNFIIDNWWFFRDFIPLPYITTVGTGELSYNVCIEDETELHSFLRSPDSLMSWSDSQVISMFSI